MAQNYGVDIQRWNGQDYDTILPTPDAHASTHQADGSDPITVKTGNIENSAVTTTKIASGAVTRAKLAQDALYSPTKIITADRNIEADDLGKTLWPKWASNNTTFTLNLDQSVSTGLPTGFEFAVCRMFAANRINISFSGIRVTQSGNGTITRKGQSITVTVPEIGGMFAMKKFDATSSAGDLWLLTGNVEVVS